MPTLSRSGDALAIRITESNAPRITKGFRGSVSDHVGCYFVTVKDGDEIHQGLMTAEAFYSQFDVTRRARSADRQGRIFRAHIITV